MADRAPQFFLSIVIPTYNRYQLVRRSIESAREWRGDRQDVEIVIVDDGSTDGTLDGLSDIYCAEIDTGRMRLLRTPANLGASGAKNTGAAAAFGRWVMFLDSDDVLIAESRDAVLEELAAAVDRSVIFFRCRNLFDGSLMGQASSSKVGIGVREYLTDWRWGECLPVVDRARFSRFPYEQKLRGHEGIAYARLFKYEAPGLVSPVVARRYDDSGDDRLSRRAALLQRSHLLAAGYAATLREFSRDLGMSAALFALRVVAYTAIAAALASVRTARRVFSKEGRK